MKIAVISIADYSECTEGMPHDVERLYFRMILKMLSRESGLPDDDSDNARVFGYKDVRSYKSLKAKLLAWPNTIYIDDRLIKNDRVEADIADYRSKRAAAVENGKLGGQARGVRTRIKRTSPGLRPKIDPTSNEDRSKIGAISGAEVGPISHATDNKNNDLVKPSPTPTPSPTLVSPPLPPAGGTTDFSNGPGIEAQRDAPRSPPKPHRRRSFTVSKETGMLYRPDAATRLEAQALAKGWALDGPDGLIAEFNGMNEGVELRDADAAFIGFCRKTGPHEDFYVWKPTGKQPPQELTAQAGEIAIAKMTVSWDRWLAHVEKFDRPAAERMRGVFVVFAQTKDPVPGSPIPRIPTINTKGKAA